MDDNVFEVVVPSYYVVGRATDPDTVRSVLRITPCLTAIVSDFKDVSFAQQFAEDTVLLNEDPLQVAELTCRPCFVVGDGDSIDAIYKDGRRENIAKSTQEDEGQLSRDIVR